jgi:hypothetical protein
VDDFLRRQQAVLRDTLLQVSAPSVELPDNFPDTDRDAFQRYLLSAPHKAFAASTASGLGMSVVPGTAKEAEKQRSRVARSRRLKARHA